MNSRAAIYIHMKRLKLIQMFLIVSTLCFFVGCTNKGMYESLQNRQRLDCQKLPPSQSDDCMKKNEETYAEYKRKKDELEK